MPAQSRLSQVRHAVRPALKARLMLSASYGAGKTRTSLILARELAEGGKVLMIDTEKESALTYADHYSFEHLPWAAPFAPAELTEVLQNVGDYAAVIIDSATHFWNKEGGILEIADGKFGGWKTARPVQEQLVQAILSCPAHVLLCVRSKTAYSVTEDSRGKQKIERVGMEPQQDADLAYEINVALDLSMDHTLTVTKTRCEVLPINRAFRAGESNVIELARIYREWLKGGEPLLGRSEAEALIEMFDTLEGKEDRKLAKRLFVEAFARPEMLRASQLDDATQWITDYLARGGPPESTSGPDTELRGEAGALNGENRSEQSSADAVTNSPPPPAPSETAGDVARQALEEHFTLWRDLGFDSEAEMVKAHDEISETLTYIEAGFRGPIREWMTEHGYTASTRPAVKAEHVGPFVTLLGDTLTAQYAAASTDSGSSTSSEGAKPEPPPLTEPPTAAPPTSPTTSGTTAPNAESPGSDPLIAANAKVEAMTDEAVIVGLTDRGIAVTGNKAARRLRLVTAMAHELTDAASKPQETPQDAPEVLNGSGGPSMPGKGFTPIETLVGEEG